MKTTQQRTPNQVALAKLISSAMFWPGEESKEARETVIAGKRVNVRFVTVNRKCYDNMPTPTLYLTIDGKRASRKDAYAMFS